MLLEGLTTEDVCGAGSEAELLEEPEPPVWLDERTRGRKQR